MSSLACVDDQVLPLPPLFKFSPLARSLHAMYSTASPAVHIALVDGASSSGVLASLNAGLKNTTGIHNLVAFDDDGLLYEYLLPLLNKPSETESNLNVIERLGRFENSLGHGVVVGISDSGLYMDHDQFDQPSPREFGTINPHARKVVLYEPMADRVDQSKSVTCGHGSHVSGILAGSSWSQLHPDVGVAPQAKIAFADIGSQQAQNLDEYLFNHPEILVVIAAGNGGDDGVRTISSPAGAKNVITVGASLTSADSLLSKFRCPRVYNPQSVASFSSQGPTSDGRMKPDLVAPGEVLWSAKSEAPGSTAKTSDVCPLQGTSQATPVVAGMAVLIYEWLRDGWWHEGVYDTSVGMTYIPASLIKALLVHSSSGLVRRLDHNKVHQPCEARTSVPLHYPDMSQGYGLPNMSNVAFFSSDDPIVKFWPNALQPVVPSVTHHGQDSYPATLTRHQVFRATLVWTDPPGNLVATRMLQNDLDLFVTVRGAPHIVVRSLTSSDECNDRLNNVEMVQVTYEDVLRAVGSSELQSRQAIELELHVKGASVLIHGPQAYSVVMSITPSTGAASRRSSGKSPMNTLTASDSWDDWSSLWWASALGVVLIGLVVALVRHFRRRKDQAQPTKMVVHLHSDGKSYGST
ncbi:hypothetical protein DYB38_000151 [Aphanomyces astaci]|uniref:subtilisin n=1 Tax=Aphanomyces astaci TaxID=112090 RepID=A0A397CJG2_APHAT|nr:hypothetical protein DYB38_000151 [Aphanomyces astaci]